MFQIRFVLKNAEVDQQGTNTVELIDHARRNFTGFKHKKLVSCNNIYVWIFVNLYLR